MPYAGHQKEGAKIVLKNVSGKAKIWIDKQLVDTKTTQEAADMEVVIPAKEGIREINVLIETEKGKPAGLG